MPKRKIAGVRTHNRRISRLFIKEWLEFRGMTAEKLANETGVSKSVISKLASGSQRYHQDWVERVAWGLKCEAADLLRHPDDFLATEQFQIAARQVLRQHQ